MTDFPLWFSTGFTHILDLNGYDHILFVTLLAFSFSFENYKKLIWLITAFTIGHSITLALSTLNIVVLAQPLIEFLISLSILLTAIFHVFKTNKATSQLKFIYALTLLFGLIHGLGFSYLLRNMLGKEESITLPLFYFNLGLEAGQLVIVAFVLILLFVLTRVISLKFESIKKWISLAIGGIAVYLLTLRINDMFS
ncbi:MAG: HupE/UreJ family protein [Bacteroidota bacterium]